MDLLAEIAQLKRINAELVELLDQLVRKEMLLLQERRTVKAPARTSPTETVIIREQPRYPTWVRISDICRTSNNQTSILPISPSTWWKGVRAGTFPPPVKFGRASLWKLTDVLELVDRVGA